MILINFVRNRTGNIQNRTLKRLRLGLRRKIQGAMGRGAESEERRERRTGL